MAVEFLFWKMLSVEAENMIKKKRKKKRKHVTQHQEPEDTLNYLWGLLRETHTGKIWVYEKQLADDL